MSTSTVGDSGGNPVNHSLDETLSPRTPDGEDPGAWPVLPTETEIYLLPDGQVVIADLPAELSHLAAVLGGIHPTDEAAAIESDADKSTSASNPIPPPA